jgi:hypothetical protein
MTDNYEKLQKLSEIHKQGIISDKDYERQKRHLLTKKIFTMVANRRGNSGFDCSGLRYWKLAGGGELYKF